ncbi:hypothetical protein [Paraburkholderia caffeinilytica]|uniref:hypothetical protein n=1 Tax=Paraburkholderia caffeinilytica TaxID=1761016 RepID=UPI003DA19D74
MIDLRGIDLHLLVSLDALLTESNVTRAAERLQPTQIARLAQRYSDRLDIFELPFDARSFTLFAAWHPRNWAAPTIVWLRDALTAVAAKAGCRLGPAAGAA